MFLMCSRRGETIRAMREVENSISSIAISPCFDSEHFSKGSVVYTRKPREVATSYVRALLGTRKGQCFLPTAR